MLRWYDDLPSVRQAVAVDDDAVHHVTWRHGKIVAEDHDREAEQAFVALGGEVCPCLDIVELFSEPPEIGALLDRSPVTDPARRRRLLGMMPTPRVPSGIPPMLQARMQAELDKRKRQQRQLAAVTLLDGELRDRLLCASAIAASRSRGIVGDSEFALVEFCAAELRPALHWSLSAARRNFNPPHALGLVINFASRPTARGTVNEREGRVELQLRVRWLADVWAHGLALVGRHVVLDLIERRAADEARVRAITWTRDHRDRFEPVVEELWIARDDLGFWYALGEKAPRILDQ